MKITKKNLLRKIQILLLCKLLTFFSCGALACITKPDQIIVPGSSFEKYNITVEQSNKQHVITLNNSKVKYNYTKNCWYFIKSRKCFMGFEDIAKAGKFYLMIGKMPRRFGMVYFEKLSNGVLPQLKIYSVNSNGIEDKSLPYLTFQEKVENEVKVLTAQALQDEDTGKLKVLRYKVLGTYISKAEGRSSDGVQARGGGLLVSNSTNTNNNTQQTPNKVTLKNNQKLVNQTGCGAIRTQ